MPTLSACLIVRNEGQNLDPCLESLAPFADEICVLDTGSSDDTVQIAERLGARVGHYPWAEDFSAARNACIEMATGDWILCVDADELLDPESVGGLRPLLEDPGTQAYLVWIDNLQGGLDGQGKPSYHSIGVPRLFRNRPEIRFHRPVHESIGESLARLGVDPLEHCHLRLVHHGYSPEAMRSGDKLARNHQILARHVGENPNDLFSVYKYGLSFVALGEGEEARKWLDPAWQKAMNLADGPRQALSFLPLLGAELSLQCRLAGDLSRAHAVAQEACDEFPTVSEVLYELGEVERACGRLESSGDAYARALRCEPWSDIHTGNPGTRGALSFCGLARLSALGGDLGLAEHCVSQALELEPNHWEARTLAVRLASAQGKEQASWRSLGELLEGAPSDPHVQLLSAEMAWARQDVETARGFWRGALALPRHQSTARAWLCIAALVEGDLSAARMEVEALRASDLPEAGVLCVMGAIAGSAPDLDPRFASAPLAGEVRAWLTELTRDSRGVALGLFRGGFEALRPLLGEDLGVVLA